MHIESAEHEPNASLPFDGAAVARTLQESYSSGTLYVCDVASCDLDWDAVESVAAKLKEHGFIDHDYGEFRAVFIHEAGWVVKCPLHPAFAIGPEAELHFYETKNEAERRMLPETVDLGGAVLAQRCYPLDPARYKAERDRIDPVGHALGVPRINERTVGFRGDRFVFLTFAGHEIEKECFRRDRAMYEAARSGTAQEPAFASQ